MQSLKNAASMRALVVAAACLALATGGAAAEYRLEKTLALDPGGRFELDVDLGAVVIRGGSASGVRVVLTSPHDDFASEVDVAFDEQPGRVRIEAKRKRSGWLPGWLGGSGGMRAHWEIEVPERTDAEIDTSGGAIRASGLHGALGLDTSGGVIEVDDVVGNVDADTSGGGIRVAKVDGTAKLDTSGGSIEATDVTGGVDADTSGGGIRLTRVGGDVRADTSGGGIEIEEAGGRVQADSSGGPVAVRFAAGNARGGDLSTSGGGVRVWIDPAVGLDIDAESSGGSVKAEVPVTVRGTMSRGRLQGTVNGGGASLRLRSSGGGVSILPR